MPAYSVVIPTSGRSQLLDGVLACLVAQTAPPTAVRVVDAGQDDAAREICSRYQSKLPLVHEPAEVMSAAYQRNQGARHVVTPVVVFCDDDMTFGPEVLAQLSAALDGDAAPAGVAARIEGFTHPVPSQALRSYYRWQAGYDDAHYGARLFGPAINCWPCYERQTESLIRSDWLNSALVAYRTEIFQAERFPEFSGYSFMEDVHLSARIARRHRLAFHSRALSVHHGETTAHRIPRPELVAMQWRNRALVARTILQVPEDRLRTQLRAHRAFVALHLIRHRPFGWRDELGALWRLPELS